MADISKIKTLNGTTYDIKDAKARMLGVYYVEGPSTDKTAGTWTGTIEGLTKYYDGLSIIYVPAVAGASTTKLNINGLGAKTCYYTNKSKLTTHYDVGTPILLTYCNDSWRRADYNKTYSNATTSTAGLMSPADKQKLDEWDGGEIFGLSYGQLKARTAISIYGLTYGQLKAK